MTGEQLVSSIVVKLEEYWKELQKEFNNDTPFKVVSPAEYFKIRWDMSYLEDADDMIKDMIEDEENGNLTITVGKFECLVPDEESGIVDVKIDCCVLLCTATLTKLILDCFADLDLLERYLKQCLRHEMGHVLDNMHWSKYKTASEFIKARRAFLKEQQKAYEKYRNETDDKESYMLYHRMPEERNANNAVSLTAEEMYALEIEIEKLSNIGYDISISRD